MIKSRKYFGWSCWQQRVQIQHGFRPNGRTLFQGIPSTFYLDIIIISIICEIFSPMLVYLLIKIFLVYSINIQKKSSQIPQALLTQIAPTRARVLHEFLQIPFNKYFWWIYPGVYPKIFSLLNFCFRQCFAEPKEDFPGIYYKTSYKNFFRL